jgi:hypothetical protein
LAGKVELYIVVFWGVVSWSLVVETTVRKQSAAFIFKVDIRSILELKES